MFSICVIGQADFDFVAQTIENENWGYLGRDIRRVGEYEPDGCFLAEANGKRAGHIFSLAYGRLGWIGLLIVRPEYRRMGIGRMLLEHAIDYLSKQGVESIRLEAVHKYIDLYRSLGFTDEFDSLRFAIDTRKMTRPLTQEAEHIRHIRDEELVDIAEFDARFFGANRVRVLGNLYSDYPSLCLVSEKPAEIAGYIMGRKKTDGYWIGPWVAAPQYPDIARQLILSLGRLLGIVEGEIRVGTPGANVAAIEMLQNLGFRSISKSVRMFWGDRDPSGDTSGIYGIGGPEKG